MHKKIKLALNKYPVVPHTLRPVPNVNKAVDEVSVDLAKLYHHYYLDSFGRAPPSPDATKFEHVQFLLPCAEFRFQGSGLGVSPSIKRHRSNELGQAFCRWFLHDHLNVIYFAHVESLLTRQLHRAFDGFTLRRSSGGDTPDYFCAESSTRVYLAEAKGRYSSISFKNKTFEEWRRQFDRVVYLDAAGHQRSIKGHIVASRFATEEGSDRVQSGIWAEDPASPGDRELGGEESAAIGRAVVAAHYGGLVAKLGQPLLAAALTSGVALPEEIRIAAIAWRVVAGPLKGTRFVGGIFADSSIPRFEKVDGQIVMEKANPFVINAPTPTFFGVEESVFRQVTRSARSEGPAVEQIEPFEQTEFFFSGFSVLRDGSALGPLDFFVPEELLVL